jgi:hypothetical protein
MKKRGEREKEREGERERMEGDKCWSIYKRIRDSRSKYRRQGTW